MLSRPRDAPSDTRDINPDIPISKLNNLGPQHAILQDPCDPDNSIKDPNTKADIYPEFVAPRDFGPPDRAGGLVPKNDVVPGPDDDENRQQDMRNQEQLIPCLADI